MFFPHKIKSIKPQDRVLEIGPGGTPHPRSDILLEKLFDDPKEAEGQRGYAPKVKTDKELMYYDGIHLPFNDMEFDYIICSHVLEHVEDLDSFISEINRVGKSGYFEYPLIYYEYIYNFPEHTTLIKQQNKELLWMLKADAGLSKFQPVHNFFYETLKKNYTSMIDGLRSYFFEGFEWSESINSHRTDKIEDLVIDDLSLNEFKAKNNQGSEDRSNFITRIGKIFNTGGDS